MVRSIKVEDIEIIHKVWLRHFKEQFQFPDFLNGFLCSFAVESKGDLIAIAGIKPILESIIVVDKDFSPRERRTALLEILDTSEYFGKQNGFDQLHAFIQEPQYLNQLIRYGFNKTKGQAVVRNI
jgi:hypothetical protein